MEEENKNTEEAKIPYKGQLLTPQEFVEQYEQDTKKKERTSESIARQRLEIEKEKEEKRNALIEINLQQDQQDAQEKSNNPILGAENQKRDMSLFQVDMPFDVQTGPDLQIIPTTSYEQPIQPNMSVDYRVGGLMSLMDDNKISSFKDGGKKNKTTKSKDGTVTNKFKDKQGNTITQVKTKDGKYFEKKDEKKTAQQLFDEDFKISNEKTNYDKVEEKIEVNKKKYLNDLKNSKIKIPEDRVKKDLEEIEKSGWKLYGKVGYEGDRHTMKGIEPEKPQGFMDKAIDAISNPMTSAGFLMRGQSIPDYMQRDMDRGTFGYFANGRYHTERNPFDIALGDATGLSLANDIRDVKQGVENKNISQASWGLFGAIPGVSELKGALKGSKGVIKNADEVVEAAGDFSRNASKGKGISQEEIDAYNLAVDFKNRGLIKELPGSAEGFADWLKGKYNQKPIYRVVDVNPKVVNDPKFREQMKSIGKNPDNPYEVAEYMGTTPAPADVVNRGRRSGGHDQLIENTNKDILYFAEDPTWIGKRYGGENPYYVKTFADPLPENIMDQVKRLRSNSQGQKNYSRNFPGFDMNNVPHGVLFEDKVLSVGPNTITPIVGDKGKKVRDAVHIVSGSDFERLPNKRFDLGGLMDLINDDNITSYKKFKKGGPIEPPITNSPINTSGPRNEDTSIYYNEDIMNEDLPLSSSPSYRAYTMGKTGAYNEVTKRLGALYEGTPDERLTIKSDSKTGYNYFLNPETGKEFEPLDYNDTKSPNIQRFLINVNSGEGQTKDFYSKTDKEGNLVEGHKKPKGLNTDEDTQQNIFKDLYTQNLAKYGNKERAYFKATEAMKNVIEPQFKGSSYEMLKGNDTDKLAFNKNKDHSLSDIENLYKQEAGSTVTKALIKKYGSVKEARNKVSDEELEKLISEEYKVRTKNLKETYKDYEDKKNLLKNAKFKQGGKTTTSKSKDGTVTNVIRKKDGSTVTQVKTKDGKYFEKVKTKEQRKIDREKSLETLDQIKKSIKGPIISRSEPTLEERAEYNLGNPMKKAYRISEHFAEKGEDPVDNFRHPMAGRYTAQAAYRLRKKDNPWAPEWLNKSAAWVDANMLGIGHEATTLFKDERPWSTKLREAGEDIYNNAVGVNVGLSDASGIEKTKYLFNKSINNELPDGVVDPKGKRNMYFKKK